jgi:outer membrane protein
MTTPITTVMHLLTIFMEYPPMQRTAILTLGLAAIFASSAASAEGFSARLGFNSLNPKSDNGIIAGAKADVSNETAVTLGGSYYFTDNWEVAVDTASEYTHQVSLAGLGKVVSLKHQPVTVGVNYNFNGTEKVKPFVGLGYAWVGVRNEKGLGALTGANINIYNSKGFTAVAGLDYLINETYFIRGDVRFIDFDSDVIANGAKAGIANVDPIVYGVSIGMKF